MTEQNIEQTAEQQVSIEGLTVNGIKAEDLSAIGKATLRKIITCKAQLDDLGKQVETLSVEYSQTKAILDTLGDLLKQEAKQVLE